MTGMESDRRRWLTLKRLEAWLETPLLVLSAVWLALLVVELAWTSNRFLHGLGLAIWAVFIFEFALRFALAPRKAAFLARNLLTLVALVLPAMRLLRFARLLRLVRLARVARGTTLVRVVAGANRGMNALRRAMKRRGFGYAAALTLVVCLLGAVGMRAFEADGPNAEAFDSFGDSLWWTAMILTTMGSQAWPATPEGRVLALLLSIYAFAVFGYVAAALASFFVGRDRETAEPPLHAEISRLRGEIAELRSELARGRDAAR
jgi:voltage-gated potassium channel